MPVKSVEQQGILALHSARSLLVKQQTMLANAMRGLATEFGLTVPKGIRQARGTYGVVDADETVPGDRHDRRSRDCSTNAARWLKVSRAFEAEIVAHARHDETARRLATIPGIGPITASLIAATVVDISLFKTRTAIRRLARPGAATAFHRRQDPPWSDHQNGQPGDPQVAGPGCHVDGLPGPTMEQRRRGLAQTDSGAPPRQAGDGGTGEQDGAHRMGVDDAQRGLPCEGTCRGRSGSGGVTFRRETVGGGRISPADPAGSAEQRDGKDCGQEQFRQYR